MSKKGTVAHAGGIHRNKLAYQQRRRFFAYNSQIRIYNTKRKKHIGLPSGINTKHFESTPAVWGRWLAFTRTIEERARTRHWLWIANLKTGNKKMIHWKAGSRNAVFAGQMTGPYLTFTQCTARCHVFTYDRRSETKIRIPKPADDRIYNYAPSVTSMGTTYFARSYTGCANQVAIYRHHPTTGVEKLFDFPAGKDLYDSWTQPIPDGIRLYMSLIHCSQGEKASDIYYVDIRH